VRDQVEVGLTHLPFERFKHGPDLCVRGRVWK
jgi:hypothetical protein